MYFVVFDRNVLSLETSFNAGYGLKTMRALWSVQLLVRAEAFFMHLSFVFYLVKHA